MAKFVYSPTITDIAKGIMPLLASEDGPISPHAQQTLDTVVARLQERDHQIESALLGDLTVNSVDGSIGSTPPAGRQIWWASNFGVVSSAGTYDAGTTSVTVDVTYKVPFPTDTAIVMMTPTVQIFPYVVPGSASKTGFSARLESVIEPPAITIAFSYFAVGF